jgi:DNA gyrase/topoisomerase IV subunit B
MLRVSVADVAEADRILTDLMGNEVEARFNFHHGTGSAGRS